MTDRLSIYNAALRLLGERRLAGLTEDREPRYLLDDVWDRDGIRRCLEAAEWGFATRAQSLISSPSYGPAFGYEFAFEKPPDFVRLVAISSTPGAPPFRDYEDQGGLLFASVDPIYVRYVSDDNAFGRDYSLWTEQFFDFVAAYFAHEIVATLTASESKIERVERAMAKAELNAASLDAMGRPSVRLPFGSWSNARLAGQRTRERYRGL